jgi:hypothetical protein
MAKKGGKQHRQNDAAEERGQSQSPVPEALKREAHPGERPEKECSRAISESNGAQVLDGPQLQVA